MATKRRGHSEGSIYQRTDGLWVASVSLGYANGKRSRKTLYGKTRKEVAEKLKVVLRDRQQGLPVKVDRQTVGQFLDRWLAEVIDGDRRPSTVLSYRQYVRLHITPFIGRIQLSKLTAQDIQSLLVNRRAAGMAPRSVRYVLTILRLALGQAERWELVPRNVAALVDAPTVPRFEATPLDLDQVGQLLDTITGDRLEALYVLSVGVGLRQGEALALRWIDLDLDAEMLTVRHSLQRIDGKLTLTEPKTSRSRRTVLLPSPLVDALRQHRKRQLEERLLAGGRWHDLRLVFTTTLGTPLDSRNLTRHFKQTLQRANLPEIRWHDLRHTCATLMLTRGVSPRVMMDTLGHSQISMTLGMYSHVLPALAREAADAMGELLTRHERAS